MVTTNLSDLQNHIRKVFGELLTTNALDSYAKQAGLSMKEEVIEKMSRAGHDYYQSGTMMRLMKSELPRIHLNNTKTKMTIGLGEVDEWNWETKRGPQRATFMIPDTGEEKTIRLRPEQDLPAWIIMEFGRRQGNGVGATGIPKDFLVSYTARDQSKEHMFGPSSSYHFRKPVFFMTHKQKSDAPASIHPGIKAGNFFRDGLKASQEDVQNKLALGIEASLNEIAAKYGGRVESTL
jgi:hypothetical protein